MPDCPYCLAQPTTVVPEHVHTIAARDATIAARDEAIRVLSASLDARDSAIASLTLLLAQRDITISGLQDELKRLGSIVEELTLAIKLWESRWPKNTCPKCGYQPKEMIQERLDVK